MTGSAPQPTLTADQAQYNDGAPIRIAVAVTDPDTGSETIHGAEPDSLGRTTDLTISRTDTAVITAAFWGGTSEPLHVDGLVVTGSARYGAGPITVVVRDGQGNDTTATLAVTVAPPPMLIGSDRPGVAIGLYPGMRYFRAYSGPTEGIKPLPAARGLLYHMSFKDTPTAAMLDAWFKALPTNLATPRWQLPFDVLIEFGHECEGDRTAAAQRAGVDLVKSRAAAWNAAHPSGPRVGVIQTFTGYAQRHNSTSNAMTDGTPSTIENLWRNVDVLGVDIEKDTTAFPTGRPDHQALMGWIPLKAAALKNPAGQTGVPYILPEWAWMPPNDSELATWYTNGVLWLRKNRCAAVGVYDTNGSTANYVLSGPPQIAVQAAIAGQ